MAVPSLRQRARYRFDTSMARGPSALIGYLGPAAAVLVLVFPVRSRTWTVSAGDRVIVLAAS